MQQWQVGPVPEYIYSNSTHQPNEIHSQHPYQAQQTQQQPDMQHRDQRQFQYGPPQGSPAAQHQHQQHQQQQHHAAPGQPPMGVPQQQPAQQQQPSSQAQPATQQPQPAVATPAPSRQRKRPAPSTASPAVTATPPVPAATIPTPAPAPVTAPVPPAVAAPPAASDDAGAAPVQPPPAKKSRTNTPWTPAEEQRLKQMRDAGNSWAEIAKTFPTRTEGSVKKHWYKDMHYAEFAEDESQALLNAIKEYESNKWKVIGQKVGKPAKACEQYAKEHFPDLGAKNTR
ncbi:Transcription factor MYB3R-3 like protein [Verticillium longisporum]|uniref:Transcription factor MYB3R-3 like protein n=1 Tax=Verticillium longisporum TaxID=100787 RepID=A0A8I3ATS6_VERLO|nr:Transcription factor MYB3R-3 like protein [Verticillium longisporum]